VGSVLLEQRMIAWRVGWVVAPGDLVNDVSRVQIYNGLAPSGFNQIGARVALRLPNDHLNLANAECQRRRDETLRQLHGLPAFRPAGTWSLLLDVAALGLDCVEVSNRLLEQDVAATPCEVGVAISAIATSASCSRTSLSSGSSCLVGDCTGHWRRPRPALERSLDGRNLLVSKPTDSRLAWFARYGGEDCASRQCPAGVSQPATSTTASISTAKPNGNAATPTADPADRPQRSPKA